VAENSDCTIGGTGGSGGGGAITAAAGSYSAGALVDGASVTQGTKADTAYAGTGSASEIAIEKGIYNQLNIGSSAGNPVFVTPGTGASFLVTGQFYQTTQPISAAALPLPTNAATSANQTNVQSAPGTPQTVATTVQGNASGVPVPVSGTFWQTTQPVSIAAPVTAAPPSSNAGTPTQATGSCTTASSTILAASSATSSLAFHLASSAANAAWLNFAGATATAAAPNFDLQPGQTVTFTLASGLLPTSAVTCIGTGAVSVVEIYK
jgi:hypothetical protein